MAPLPLICPRCGRPQQVVPSGSGRHHEQQHPPVRVVHTATGEEECARPEHDEGSGADDVLGTGDSGPTGPAAAV